MKTALDFFNYRIEQMRSERSSWVPHWKELNNNFQPRKGKFFTGDRNKGSKRNQLPNNTPLFAKRTLRAGMMTGITSPARPWFRLAPPDPEMADYGPVRTWLDDVAAVMYRVFASSGLYRALPGVYEECGVIGTAALLQEEDFENITKWSPFTVGEYFLDINGDNQIDTFAREFQMTVYQMVSKFGLDNCSTHVQNLYEVGNYSSWIDIYHLIEPNEKELEGISIPKEFTWRSVYYEQSMRNTDDSFLSVKGYKEFPLHAPRWDAKPGDVYGISPGMEAIGDGLALQTQEKEKGKAVAKMVAPPTVAPSALKNTQVSLLPGANNFTDDPNNVFKAIYQVDPRVNELREDIQSTEERVNRAFFVDLFLMITNMRGIQPRNIEEIAERKEEKLLQLGPVLENLNSDLLDPIIDRTFNMLVRASEPGWRGMSNAMVIPPPPQELTSEEGVDLKVEYISILAQAQKMVSTGAMERWVGFVGNMAAIGLPGAMDKINEDEVADSMAEDLGVPNKVVRTDEEVEELREARRQQEQMAQAMEMAQAGAGIAAQGATAAKNLSETDTTGGNVMSNVLGVGS